MKLADVMTRASWEPGETVELTHYSNMSGLRVVDPEYYGNSPGTRNSGERSRVCMPGWLDRSYWGINVGKPGGYVRQPMLGGIAYTASVPGSALYNYRADPLNLLEDSASINEYEGAIAGKGYKGYWVDDPCLGLVACIFVKLKVKRIKDNG